jgi:hypothetical protein
MNVNLYPNEGAIRRTPFTEGMPAPDFFDAIIYSSLNDHFNTRLIEARNMGSIVLATNFLADYLLNLHKGEYESVNNANTTFNTQAQIDTLEYLLAYYGLCTPQEIIDVRNSSESTINRFYRTPAFNKYLPYSDLVEQVSKARGVNPNIRIGLLQGAFDAVHLGHTSMAAHVYPYCDILVVGVNKDSHLREAKGLNRPRFPLAARIAELSACPAIDAIFILETNSYYDDEGYDLIWKQLGVSVFGCGPRNPYKETYKRRLGIDGILIERTSDQYSATRVEAFQRQHPGSLGGYITQTQADLLAKQAIKNGVLRDYPNGT